MIGEKFGKLTVLCVEKHCWKYPNLMKRCSFHTKNPCTWYKCLCDCGTKITCSIETLLQDKEYKRSCRACRHTDFYIYLRNKHLSDKGPFIDDILDEKTKNRIRLGLPLESK